MGRASDWVRETSRSHNFGPQLCMTMTTQSRTSNEHMSYARSHNMRDTEG